MTELEKMLAGDYYDPNDPTLVALKAKSHRLCQRFNTLTDEDIEERQKILAELLGKAGDLLYLQGPIQFDYGCNIEFGDHSYANFNLTILDTCKVIIGSNVLIGPNVSIYTAMHPLCHEDRNLYFDEAKGYWTDDEYGKPVSIGDNCWIGGSVTILPGVTIGEGCVIGAASVVTRDIPPHSLAFGNPCKVRRKITELDRRHIKI